jgi:hypothetical protein
MSELITPKQIIYRFLEKDKSKVTFKPWDNRFQKYSLIISGVMLTIGAIFAILHFVFDEEKLFSALGLFSAVLAEIGAIIYQLSVVFSDVKSLMNPTKVALEPVAELFNSDVDLISGLANDFELHHLEYARDSILLSAERLRQRVSFIIGAVDKTGVIPALIVTYISIRQIWKDGIDIIPGIEWCLIGLVMFYMFACMALFATQRMDRLANILKHAVLKKERSIKK